MRILTAAVLAAGVVAGGVATPMAAAQSACTDLGGTVDAEKICHVHTPPTGWTTRFRPTTRTNRP